MKFGVGYARIFKAIGNNRDGDLGQPPDRGQSQVVESQSWFRAIPFNELTNRVRTVFGGFFLLVFGDLAIGAASFCRAEQHEPNALSCPPGC